MLILELLGVEVAKYRNLLSSRTSMLKIVGVDLEKSTDFVGERIIIRRRLLFSFTG